MLTAMFNPARPIDPNAERVRSRALSPSAESAPGTQEPAARLPPRGQFAARMAERLTARLQRTAPAERPPQLRE